MQAPNELGLVMLVAMFAAIPIGFLIALAIGAAILRSACSLANSITGSRYADGAVPEPSFGWAMLIQFMFLIVYFAIIMGLRFGITLLVAAAQIQLQQLQQIQLLAPLVGLPV